MYCTLIRRFFFVLTFFNLHFEFNTVLCLVNIIFFFFGVLKCAGHSFPFSYNKKTLVLSGLIKDGKAI